MKKVDVTIGKKTSELQGYITDMQIRLKTIEDDMNEDGNDDSVYQSKNMGKLKSRQSIEFTADLKAASPDEDGDVKIDAEPTPTVTQQSELR